MKFAYADPPYLGLCSRYNHPDQDGCWNDPNTHHRLINQLSDCYPDGWALSASSTSLQTLLSFCPSDVRVAAWVKPFAAFKANVRNVYTWEAVILRGGRVSTKDGAPVTRDHLSCSITLKKGVIGAKPVEFCEWVLRMLGYLSIHDLFPGSGAMAQAIAERRGQMA